MKTLSSNPIKDSKTMLPPPPSSPPPKVVVVVQQYEIGASQSSATIIDDHLHSLLLLSSYKYYSPPTHSSIHPFISLTSTNALNAHTSSSLSRERIPWQSLHGSPVK